MSVCDLFKYCVNINIWRRRKEAGVNASKAAVNT